MKSLKELKAELKNSNCTDCEKRTMNRLLDEVVSSYESKIGALEFIKEKQKAIVEASSIFETTKLPLVKTNDIESEPQTEAWNKGVEAYNKMEVSEEITNPSSPESEEVQEIVNEKLNETQND